MWIGLHRVTPVLRRKLGAYTTWRFLYCDSYLFCLLSSAFCVCRLVLTCKRSNSPHLYYGGIICESSFCGCRLSFSEAHISGSFHFCYRQNTVKGYYDGSSCCLLLCIVYWCEIKLKCQLGTITTSCDIVKRRKTREPRNSQVFLCEVLFGGSFLGSSLLRGLF